MFSLEAEKSVYNIRAQHPSSQKTVTRLEMIFDNSSSELLVKGMGNQSHLGCVINMLYFKVSKGSLSRTRS